MFRLLRNTTAALMISAAIVAPTALARPIDVPLPPVKSATGQPQHSNTPGDIPHGAVYSSFDTSRPVADVVEASDGGFDWGDAGIGAAVMLGLVSVGAGGALLIGRRSRGRGHPATG